MTEDTSLDDLMPLIAEVATLKNLNKDLLAKHISETPKRFQLAQLRAVLGKLSPRQAIAQCCRECCGFEDVTERIKECKSFRCPLHTYRPYQDK